MTTDKKKKKAYLAKGRFSLAQFDFSLKVFLG